MTETHQHRCHLFLWVLALLLGLVYPGLAEGMDPAQQARSDVQAARLEMDCGNLEKAVELLQGALQLQPEWIVPHQYLAPAYQKQGDQERAVAEYTVVQAQYYEALPSGRSNPPETKDAVLKAEATAMWLVNQTRQENELKLLRPDPRLAIAAREHSLEMRDLGYFEHTSPTEALRTPMDRFRAVFNFLPRCIAENIARRWGGDGPCLTLERVTETHQDFLKSPNHRSNLLLTQVTCAAIGIATNEQGHYWLAQEFAQYSHED